MLALAVIAEMTPEKTQRLVDMVAAEAGRELPEGYRSQQRWIGALSGPRAALYQTKAFADFRFALFEHEPDRPERLESPRFARAEPEEMLIDEVEAIWSAVDLHEDWTPFHAKIERLRAD